MVESLEVFLNEKEVGEVIKLPSGKFLFSFSERYKEESKHPTLSQSFLNGDGELASGSKAYRNKVPPFFSNLLPEGKLREYLANQCGIKKDNEFGLLKYLGADLPGAVIIKSAQDNASEDVTSEALLHTNNQLRFSLAGVQLKFSALMEKHGGLTIPASGLGGNWIVKLPSPNHDYVPENEFAITKYAEELGMDVPEVRLIEMNQIQGIPETEKLRGELALVVKRFDREPSQRIHMEDFAQVFEVFPNDKYEKVGYAQIAKMLWHIAGETSLQEYIKRLVYSIFTGNGDMHLKNWSFLYPDGVTPVISPAYDLLSTIPYIANDKLALNLAGEKQMERVTLNHFIKIIEKAELPRNLILNTVTETTEKIRDTWNDSPALDKIPSMIRDKIDNHKEKIKL